MNSQSQIEIRVADQSLNFRGLSLPGVEATGSLILEAAGVTAPNAVLLQRLSTGDLEDIRLHEKPDISAGTSSSSAPVTAPTAS
ncbi:MAG: multiubiquitin domain-containing protein [Acidobacteriaceae bacterium]